MKRNEEGFLQLDPIPGGFYDRWLHSVRTQASKQSIPKDPDEMLDTFVDKYGVDRVMNMDRVDIGEYVYDRGINYSLNMNVGRNIPWIEDGLKAVERRALYTMYTAGLYHNKFDKVAGITGDMLKNVHPHGDASAADTIYRLGRKRSIMIPYIKPYGNFGNMEDMRPASPRYASASLSDYAVDCFFSEMGAKYPIFDVKDNYKYSGKEPVFLTSRYPNILMQWNLGIGKGAQAWLGAFNSVDIFNAALKLLDDPNAKINIYPDTPIPVDIVNGKDLKGCFDKSRFKVEMQAKYEVVTDKKKNDHGTIIDKHTIVFTSLPLSVTGNTVRNEIVKIKEEDAKKPLSQRRLPEVLNLEIAVTDKTPGGIRFIVEYEKGYDPSALAKKLIKCTSLGKTIGVKYLLITDNKPELYTPRQVMNRWISQRYDQKRRYYHQLVLKAAKDRSRLEAICVVLENSKNIDKTIKLIRQSNTNVEAVQALMKAFDFSEFQANCIIQIKLANLPRMNIDETRKERDKALSDYKHYRKLLSSNLAIKEAIREELEQGLKKYGKPRNADILKKQITVEGTPVTRHVFYNKEYFLSTTENKKLPLTKEMKYLKVRQDDMTITFARNGLIKILDGNSFTETDTGIGFNQVGFNSVASILVLNDNLKKVLIITKKGTGKIMKMEDIYSIKSKKTKVMTLPEDDEIVAVLPLSNTEDPYYVVTSTTDGKSYIAPLSLYPKLKRVSYGTKVTKSTGDVIDAFLVKESPYYLFYGEYGQAKVVNHTSLCFNKRKLPTVSMQGKYLMGVVGLDSRQTIRLFSLKEDQNYTVQIGKAAIVMTPEKGVPLRIRFGTTIGDTNKVFKYGRNEFYDLS